MAAEEITESDKPCSFCKAPRKARRFLFHNPAQDCIICDVCVQILNNRLAEVNVLAEMPEGTTVQ